MTQPFKCPACDGQGKRVLPPAYSGGTCVSMTESPCHACNGTGIVWSPDKHWSDCLCKKCDPEGYVEPGDGEGA